MTKWPSKEREASARRFSTAALRNRAWTGAPFFGVYLAGSHSLHPRLWRSCHLALSRRSQGTSQLVISRLRTLMASRPIICGVAAGVDGGAVGAIGLVAVAGDMRGDAVAPATADAAAPFFRVRLAAPRYERNLPHGPGLIRFQRPPAARKSSFDDGADRRALSGCGSPLRLRVTARARLRGGDEFLRAPGPGRG
jgi:hypothetical protein